MQTNAANFEETRKLIRARMEGRGIHPEAIEAFLRRASRVNEGFSGRIPWSEIDRAEAGDLARFEDLKAEATPGDLARLVVVKLNGGLGTSMGLSKAKTLLPVKKGETFLSIIRRQTECLRRNFHAPVPLVFMSSVATQDDTLAAPGIADINAGIPGHIPPSFLQSWVPRLRRDNLAPLTADDEEACWCPPGHGDIFMSLRTTGILDALLDAGIEAAFISNGDNLGASFDGRILRWFLDERLDFAMEVTPKTKADLKGGALFRSRPAAGESRLGLLEIAQVESGHEQDFQDLTRFPHFNTNNLWLNLKSLKAKLASGGLDLPVIVNGKNVGGTDVLQLETAMGAAIGSFERTRGLIVPRTRFAPVKTNADLLVRRSDCYLLREEDGALVRDPARTLGEPSVKLSGDYKNLGDFDRLVRAVPSLVGLQSLEVEGPVEFDVPVKLVGDVRIVNTSGKTVPISAAGKSVIQDEVVTL
jgi:UDP-glucose pyrophosphorylase